MPEYKIKLSESQANDIIEQYKKNKKNMKFTIKHDDLLASNAEKPVVMRVSKDTLNEIVNAFNENRDAYIVLTRSNLLAVVYVYKRELITRVDQAPRGAGVELWSTSDQDLMRYAERLGIEPFSVISIDEPLETDIGIYNSMKRGEPGAHWCCWYIDKKHNFVFDPFGMAIDKRMIKKIKENNNNKIVRSTLQEQGIEESSCGQRCIVLLNELHKAKDPKERFDVFYKHCTTTRDINKEWRKLKLPFNKPE